MSHSIPSFFNVEGGEKGLWIRCVITILLMVGAVAAYFLPSIKHNAHNLPFTVGGDTKTVVVKEKQVLTSSRTTTPGR